MNWDGIVSLLIFCIEAILLVNVLYFSRKDKSLWKGVLLIALLASYQLIEYLICGLDQKYSFAAFLAFSVISFLPPLGLLFVLDLLKKRSGFDILLILPPVFFIILYLFNVEKFAVVKCSVIYAVYNYPYGEIFGLFYYLPIVASIFLLFYRLKSRTPLLKKNSQLLLSGYLFVSIPVISAFVLHFAGYSFLLSTIESIMCKSAVVLAVCYSIVILNLTGKNNIEGSNT
ncbi:MAG: hypothetical protein EHM47_17475 [Ignavibacteriales bacterium]|nr:MAG: hypothetical protein EHM47_17475 [Ignavibacteriales bacterium]